MNPAQRAAGAGRGPDGDEYSSDAERIGMRHQEQIRSERRSEGGEVLRRMGQSVFVSPGYCESCSELARLRGEERIRVLLETSFYPEIGEKGALHEPWQRILLAKHSFRAEVP